jgi:excisionase family DNA binding protein
MGLDLLCAQDADMLQSFGKPHAMADTAKQSKRTSLDDALEGRQLTLEDWVQTREQEAASLQAKTRAPHDAPERSATAARETQLPSGGGLLTTREVADALHVHPRTVQRLVERGELAVVRLGAAIRFDPAELVRFIAERTRIARSPEPEQETLRARTAGVSFARRLRSKPA